jgi:hypothetical protein
MHRFTSLREFGYIEWILDSTEWNVHHLIRSWDNVISPASDDENAFLRAHGGEMSGLSSLSEYLIWVKNSDIYQANDPDKKSCFF